MTLPLLGRLSAILALTMLVPQRSPITEDTLFVECRGGPDRTLRGPIISSPSGYRARVTVTAQMRRVEGWPYPVCGNTSSLFVASPRAARFSMVFRKNPTPEELGNGLRLVDWAPDGRTLAALSLWWQPGGRP
jgi:hypothetical protein